MTRNALYSLLTGLLLWGSTSHAIDHEVLLELHTEACVALEVDCDTIDMARVEYAPLYAGMGALGTYRASRPGVVWIDVGFLDPHAHNEYQNGTILHEIVHYIDYEYLRQDDIEWDVCESEAKAWRIENSYFTRIGKYEFTNWNWREDYAHCQLGYEDD